jgi:hypothetical protein
MRVSSTDPLIVDVFKGVQICAVGPGHCRPSKKGQWLSIHLIDQRYQRNSSELALHHNRQLLIAI